MKHIQYRIECLRCRPKLSAEDDVLAISASIVIDAPVVDKVWGILLNFPSYPEW